VIHKLRSYDRPLTQGERVIVGLATFLLVFGIGAFVVYMAPVAVYAVGIGVGVLLVRIDGWAR